MSRELLKEILDQHEKGFIEAHNTRARAILKKIEAELAKRDEPVGYILEYASGKYYSDFTVNLFAAQTKSEDLGAKPVKVYLDHQPRQQEPLSKPYPLSFYHGSTGDYINGFEDGVAWAEDQHGIGGGK